mgnify:CR=1 FL=1
MQEDDYPVAKWINRNGFYIASHQDLTQTQKEYIVEVFQDYFSGKEFKSERSGLLVISKTDNEPDSISLQETVDSIPLDIFDEFILVDDSKSDKIRSFFRQRGFKVVYGAQGKGHALQLGINECKSENIIVMGIGGSDDVRNLDEMLINLKKGVELVIASRFLVGGGRATDESSISFRSIGNRFFTFLLSIVYDKNVTDCNNCLRGFKRKAIVNLNLKEKGDGVFFEMTARSLLKNLKFIEIPTFEKRNIISVRSKRRFISAFLFVWILLKQIARK